MQVQLDEGAQPTRPDEESVAYEAGFSIPRASMNAIILNSSVGRARVGRWRRVRVGATTLRANAREAEQRPRTRCKWLNRVRSAVTQKVNSVEAEIVNVHQELSKKSSGQLRNLGSSAMPM